VNSKQRRHTLLLWAESPLGSVHRGLSFAPESLTVDLAILFGHHFNSFLNREDDFSVTSVQQQLNAIPGGTAR